MTRLSILALLKRTLTRGPTARSSAPAPTARLGVEALEGRDMMAASLTASLSAGVLRVEGTEGRDVIAVSRVGDQVAVGGVDILVASSRVPSVPASQVSRVEIISLGGDDGVALNSGPSIPVALRNSGGNDQLSRGDGTAAVAVPGGQFTVWLDGSLTTPPPGAVAAQLNGDYLWYAEAGGRVSTMHLPTRGVDLRHTLPAGVMAAGFNGDYLWYAEAGGRVSTVHLPTRGVDLRHTLPGGVLDKYLALGGKYLALGGPSGMLGRVTGGGFDTGGGWWAQDFAGGRIYTNGVQTYAVLGDPLNPATFLGRFAASDFQRGLGLPTTDLIVQGDQQVQYFEGGAIYSSPVNGLWVVKWTDEALGDSIIDAPVVRVGVVNLTDVDGVGISSGTTTVSEGGVGIIDLLIDPSTRTTYINRRTADLFRNPVGDSLVARVGVVNLTDVDGVGISSGTTTINGKTDADRASEGVMFVFDCARGAAPGFGAAL